MNHTQDLSRIIGELTPFADTDKQTQRQQRRAKTCASLTEAIRRSGLRDGMTISFHHAFRGGDLTLNLVMDQLATMGFKNLTLASSSLSACHAPLVDHIRNGVVNRIYTSGLRGPLAEEISRGLMAHPVQIHSHGGRAHREERRAEYRCRFPRRPVLRRHGKRQWLYRQCHLRLHGLCDG